MSAGSPRPTPTDGSPQTDGSPPIAGGASGGAASAGGFGRDGEPGPWGRSWGWWREIARLIPPPQRRGRRADTDLAAVVAAILYKQSSNCPWRRLPKRFPPWQTVYSYHRRWLKDGTLRRIRDKVREADG